jgi:hypothetical protein
MTETRRYRIATICGSMRYYQKMLTVAAELSEAGWIVLFPFASVEEGTATKLMLDDMHFQKIAMSDLVMVVGTHLGDSTKREVAYAQDCGVQIQFRIR